MTDASSDIASRTAGLALGGANSALGFQDVTRLLDNAAKDMKTGQLIQREAFSLFDAMCAIVIMDPKMDTGMALDDAVAAKYNVSKRLDPKELIWIMDNILIGQMTWLSGHALSQTLLTSCYVLRLLEIEDYHMFVKEELSEAEPPKAFHALILYSYILAVCKTCNTVWEEMRKNQVFEEEDFMTNKFGVSLHENFPTAMVFAKLDEAVLWLQGDGNQWIKSKYPNEATVLQDALQSRIQVARSFLLSTSCVSSPRYSHFTSAREHLQDVRTAIKDMKSTSSLGVEVPGAFDYNIHRKLVSNTPPRSIALLTLQESFEQLDHSCIDLMSICNAFDFDSSHSLLNFFIQFGCKKPAPGAYARSILQTVLYDDKMTMGNYPIARLVRNLIQESVLPPSWTFELLDVLLDKEFGPDRKKASTTTFGSSQPNGPLSTNTPSPDSTAATPSTSTTSKPASTLQPPTTSTMGMASIPEAEDESEIKMLKRQAQETMVLFIEKASKPVIDTMQIMGQNVSRQRRNLRKIVLLWETLQEEAEGLDLEVHQALDAIARDRHLSMGDDENLEELPKSDQFYFVSWAYNMKLWVMNWLLLLGSELELYSDFEYLMVYGYCDYIFAAHQRHIGRISAVIESDVAIEEQLKELAAATAALAASEKSGHGSGSASSKNKKKKKKKKPTGVGPSTTAAGTPTSPSAVPINPPGTELGNSNNSELVEPSTIPMTAVQQAMIFIRLQLSRATFLTLAALTKSGHLTQTPSHVAIHGLNDMERLFAHRFKAFQTLSSPEPWSMEHFRQQMACEDVAPLDILKYAANYYAEAKVALDRTLTLSAENSRTGLCEEAWKKDLMAMVKVCIAGKITLLSISNHPEMKASAGKAVSGSGAEQSKKSKVQFRWEFHPWWPVIGLEPIKK